MAARWQQWMPLYIDRFLGSPDVQMMEPAEFKGYVCLLMAAWQTEDCSLPSDEAELAIASRLGTKLWRKHSDRILRKFVSANGRLRNEVCYDEWLKASAKFDRNCEAAEELKHKRSEAGKRGNQTRWPNSTREDRSPSLRSQRIAAARAKATHTPEQWESLLTLCGRICQRCGSSENIVKDHIIPIYQEGSDGIENLQPLCARCNSSKGSENFDYRPEFWRECLANASQSSLECLANASQSSLENASQTPRKCLALTGTITGTGTGGTPPLPPSPAPSKPDEPDPPHDFNADPADTIPDGLAPMQYAHFVLTEAAIPAGYALKVKTGDAIEMLARLESCGMAKAAKRLLDRMRAAQARGDKVNGFWLEDGHWKQERTAGISIEGWEA